MRKLRNYWKSKQILNVDRRIHSAITPDQDDDVQARGKQGQSKPDASSCEKQLEAGHWLYSYYRSIYHFKETISVGTLLGNSLIYRINRHLNVLQLRLRLYCLCMQQYVLRIS
jgi:hypothetical protein